MALLLRIQHQARCYHPYPRDNAGQGNQQGSVEELSDAQVTAEIGSIDTPLRALDLMFVFDTTGSMGDELLYLHGHGA